MKRAFHTAAGASLALMLSILAGPAVPAPPAGRQTILDRHHLLYGTVIPGPTDAPNGVPGEPYVCLSCHAADTGSSTNAVIVERECRACHNPDRHHHLYGSVIPYRTDVPYSAAGDLYICTSCHAPDAGSGEIRFPVGRDCRACHEQQSARNVIVDIRPFSGKNLINPGSSGVLLVAILGSEDYRVSDIDISSIRLETQVAPLWARIMKRGRPYQNLVLAFSSEAMWNVIGHLQPCQSHELRVTGAFNDGRQLSGSDSVVAAPCKPPR